MHSLPGAGCLSESLSLGLVVRLGQDRGLGPEAEFCDVNVQEEDEFNRWAGVGCSVSWQESPRVSESCVDQFPQTSLARAHLVSRLQLSTLHRGDARMGGCLPLLGWRPPAEL